MKLYIWVFLDMSRKFNFHENLTRKTGTLRENLPKFGARGGTVVEAQSYEP
jgi:hypothetical protein